MSEIWQEAHLDAAAGQAEFARQHVIVVQSGQLAQAEIETDDVRQITPTEAGIQTANAALRARQFRRCSRCRAASLRSGVQHRPKLHPFAHRPGRVNERQARPVVPFLRPDRTRDENPANRRASPGRRSSSTASASTSSAARSSGNGHTSACTPGTSSAAAPGQARTGARAFIERDAANPSAHGTRLNSVTLKTGP